MAETFEVQEEPLHSDLMPFSGHPASAAAAANPKWIGNPTQPKKDLEKILSFQRINILCRKHIQDKNTKCSRHICLFQLNKYVISSY